jgi:hypothetical protein
MALYFQTALVIAAGSGTVGSTDFVDLSLHLTY